MNNTLTYLKRQGRVVVRATGLSAIIISILLGLAPRCCKCLAKRSLTTFRHRCAKDLREQGETENGGIIQSELNPKPKLSIKVGYSLASK